MEDSLQKEYDDATALDDQTVNSMFNEVCIYSSFLQNIITELIIF